MLTITVNGWRWRDDAGWKEDAHPRVKSGKGGGQFTKGSSGGAPSNKGRVEGGIPYGGNFPDIKKVHQLATDPKLSPQEAATLIKAEIVKKSSHYAANYANKVLRALEKKHGLKANELGTAVTKKQAAATPAPESEKKVESALTEKSEAAALPHPSQILEAAHAPFYAEINKIAVNSQFTEPQKLQQILKLAIQGNETTKKYAAAAAAGIVNGTFGSLSKQTEPPSKTVLPQPHAGSTPQAVVFAHANDKTLSPQEKADKIAVAVKGLPEDGFSKKYAKQVSDLLKLPTPSASVTSGPAQSPTAPASEVHESKRFKTFEQRLAAAHQGEPSSVSGSGTVQKWSTAPAEQQKAATWYTGSGYSAMNSALRDPDNAAEHAIESINHLDDAFDSSLGKLEKDVVSYRGFQMPEGTLTKLLKALKLGLPARVDQQGFISTSTSEGTASSFGSSKNVLMRILVKKETPALWMKPISGYASENELLLRHGQSFEVLRAEKKPGENRYTLHVVTT